MPISAGSFSNGPTKMVEISIPLDLDISSRNNRNPAKEKKTGGTTTVPPVSIFNLSAY
jgi:hypothetical protein